MTFVQRLRAGLIPAYQQVTNRLPFVAPLYRSVIHREAMPPFRRKFAAGRLHEAIKREVGDRRGGFFFEAGANDGLLFSNTAYLERYCGWTGLLVEAVPHKFVECVWNRPHSIVEHCALVPPDFPERAVEIFYSNLMSYTPSLTDVDGPAQIGAGRPFLLSAEKALSNQRFFAPAMTLSSVLTKHGVDRIDFMVLDLEGAELGALSGLDFQAVHIERVLIEVRDLPAADAFFRERGFARSAHFGDLDYVYARSA